MSVHRLESEDSFNAKKQKKTKFGREVPRNITRTTRRKSRFDKVENEKTDDLDSNSEEVEDGDEDVATDDESGKSKNTIASKRSNKGMNKMAYSALVTLLSTENDSEDEESNDDEKADNNEDDEDDSDDSKESGEEREEGGDEIEHLNAEEQEQDDLDVLNKYDSFNLHFNKETEIDSVINNYEKLATKDQKIHLINKKEIKNINDEDDEDEKYIKYRYGFPQCNSSFETEEADKRKSGSTLASKLKYYNVKQKVQEKFQQFEDTNKLDLELIDSIINYETLNFQYFNNENIKSKYQEYYLLHIINHLMKTRDRIMNNNQKKAIFEKKLKEGNLNNEELKDEEFRDQGYTRPKVLILLPSRNFAYKVVNKLIKLLNIENVENKKKFKTQFYENSKIKDRIYHSRISKDFEEFFDGNTNDLFVLGIKHTRKTLKLYSGLEQSDIIIASPIGLLKLYKKIENGGLKKNDGLKNNFLSSIEICIVDKAEGILMQNWSNFKEIFSKYLNKIPTDFINVDFSRIRMWSINGFNKYLTQFLIFDKYFTPEMISLIKNSKNLISGSTSFIPIKSMSIINMNNYKMYQLGLINKYERLKQIFMKFEINSIVEEPLKRFEFFKNVLLPQILNKSSYKFGTLIYIPSYFDYLKIKKYLKNDTNVSFVSIDEYSSSSQLTRNRALFKNRSNNARIMLYTERLHFYKRFEIKGVRNILFYQLPTDPDFYSDILQFIALEKLRIEQEKNKMKISKSTEEDGEDDDEEEEDEETLDMSLCMIRAMYSKLDAIRFSPIVGVENVGRLSNADNESTEFS